MSLNFLCSLQTTRGDELTYTGCGHEVLGWRRLECVGPVSSKRHPGEVTHLVCIGDVLVSGFLQVYILLGVLVFVASLSPCIDNKVLDSKNVVSVSVVHGQSASAFRVFVSGCLRSDL